MHKLNELGLQLSGDAVPDSDPSSSEEGYFRLDVGDSTRQAALTPDGLYYTKADWDKMETAAARYGIKIVPFINMYEHASAWEQDTAAGKPDTSATSGLRTSALQVDISDAAKITQAAKYFADLLGLYAHPTVSVNQWFRGDTIIIGGGDADAVPGYMVTLRSSITTALSQFKEVQMFHWPSRTRGVRLQGILQSNKDFVQIRKDPHGFTRGPGHSATGVDWPSDSFIEGTRYCWTTMPSAPPARLMVAPEDTPRAGIFWIRKSTTTTSGNGPPIGWPQSCPRESKPACSTRTSKRPLPQPIRMLLSTPLSPPASRGRG